MDTMFEVDSAERGRLSYKKKVFRLYVFQKALQDEVVTKWLIELSEEVDPPRRRPQTESSPVLHRPGFHSVSVLPFTTLLLIRTDRTTLFTDTHF